MSTEETIVIATIWAVEAVMIIVGVISYKMVRGLKLDNGKKGDTNNE